MGHIRPVASKIRTFLLNPKQHIGLWAAIIFLVTCAIRIAFIFESNTIASIRTPTPGMDVDLYWQAARLINQGACGDQPCFELMMCSSAFYPFWLAFWQMVIGPDMLLHRLVNACLVSLSAVLMFRLMFGLTRRFLPAIVCSLVWATLPSLIYFDSTLYKTSLAIFFFLILLTMVLYEPDTPRTYPYVVKGVLTAILLSALFLLQSATFLFSAVVFAYYSLDRQLGPKKKRALLASLAGCLVLIGLGYHFRDAWSNYHYARYLPEKGFHFRIGFNEQSDGTYVKLKGIDPWPYGHNFQARMAAEVASAKPLTAAESDRYYTHQALSYIADHPLDSLALVVRKALLFFNDYEVKGVDDLYYLKRHSLILSLTPFSLGIVVIFAALGFIHLLDSRQYRLTLLLGGMLGAVLTSNLIIFISWRYRLLNLVPLMLLSSFGVLSVQEKTLKLIHCPDPPGKRLIRYLGIVLLPLIAAGLLTYSPVIGEKGRTFYRQAEVNDKLSRTAEKLLKQLHRRERQASPHPKAITRKALLLNQLHRHSEAFALFKSICDQSLENPIADHQYLIYLMWLGEYDEAVELVQAIKDHNADLLPRIVSNFKPIEKQAFKEFIEKKIT